MGHEGGEGKEKRKEKGKQRVKVFPSQLSRAELVSVGVSVGPHRSPTLGRGRTGRADRGAGGWESDVTDTDQLSLTLSSLLPESMVLSLRVGLSSLLASPVLFPVSLCLFQVGVPPYTEE